MSRLGQIADEYLQIRRTLGYKLTNQGRVLLGFVRYLDDIGVSRITVEASLAFATQPKDAQPIWWSRRLSVVRGFAAFVQTIDPDTEVPPKYALARGGAPRAVPYLYSASQVTALMAAARSLRTPLLAATYETLLGLLAVTGIRVGEAIALNRDDVDLARAVLSIRSGKFGKARMVPVHPSTVGALQTYAARRDELRPRCAASSFFMSTAGTRLTYGSVRAIFARLAHEVGVEALSQRCRPRLHDFRHRFAVQTLLGWYRSHVNVAARLPLLSTYLGHVHPQSTYWYLSATPDLLAVAANRIASSEVNQ